MTGRSFNKLPEDVLLQVNRLCNRYEAACRSSSGQTPKIEDWLGEVDTQYHAVLIEELIPLELAYRRKSGELFDITDYRQRFPEFDAALLDDEIPGPKMTTSNHEQTPVTSPDRTSAENGETASFPKQIGDYEIIAVLGSGGMGDVYRAVHRRMDRTVALKVLRPEISKDPGLIQRFNREVKAAARLSHPNIVAAFNAREEDGVYCLITEFIDGEDLQAIVRRDGPLSVDLAVNVVLQVARGLEYAHGKGVIHRDIKPANILLEQAETVKILDMGLARFDQEGTARDEAELPATGMIMGTAAYMSPEQARNTKNADARSDIYSLGCTLYFLLTGRLTYVGETLVDTILAHASEPIPSLRDDEKNHVAPEIDAIFRQMVAKNPFDRFQSMTEVIRALESLFDVPVSPASSGTIKLRTSIENRKAQLEERPTRDEKLSWLRVSNKWLFVLLLSVVIGIGVASKLVPGIGDGNSSADVYSLRFDGSSSYVAVPSLIPDPSRKVTLEVICKVEQMRLSNVISWLGPDWMALFLSPDGYWGVARRIGNESRVVVASEPVRLSQWYHLAATWDGQELQLFVNGQRSQTMPLGFTLPEASGGLFIGGVPLNLLPPDQNDRFFSGRIHAVKISEGVLYKESFRRLDQIQADQSTLALYRFDEARGSTVEDASHHNHVATINNATWVQQAGP